MRSVLLASYSGAYGGAERVGLDWLLGLDAERWLACPEGPFATAARRHGVRVLPLAERSPELRRSARDALATPWRLQRHGAEVRARAGDIGAELLLACGMRSAAALTLVGSQPQVPVVFEHHDLPVGRVVRALTRLTARRSALVVAPSRAVAAGLRDADGRPPRVVPPGVAITADGATAPGGRTDDRPAAPTVLLAGAIEPWKRPDLALEALALARRSHPELRLRVLGAPHGEAGRRLLAELRARAAAPDLAGAVAFTGEVADVPTELSRALCLLHAAPREPFGLVLLEAMAAGCPVLAPDATGPAELLDVTCGLLYPPGDVPAAARALLALVEDPDLVRRLGDAGRARARAHFSLARSRERFAAALSDLHPLRGAPAGAPLAGASSAGPTELDLTLVTVTRNSAAELARLLDSAERHLPGARVLVVDAHSSDDSLAVAARPRPALVVETIALDVNVGFGRASNRGVAAVRTSVTALVNPDVELVDGSLAELARRARSTERDGRAALIAPLVLSPDGTRQDSVHPRPVTVADGLRAVLPRRLVPRSLAERLWPWLARTPRPVGWAVGCALVGPTETLRQLGPFDPRFSLFGEDLALGLDAARAGVTTWFWPSARVLHTGRHASDVEFGAEPFARLARGRREAVRSRMGRRAAALDGALQALTFLLRIVARSLLGGDPARERRQLRAVLAGGRAGPLPDLGEDAPA